jgi:hypothetical protein
MQISQMLKDASRAAVEVLLEQCRLGSLQQAYCCCSSTLHIISTAIVLTALLYMIKNTAAACVMSACYCLFPPQCRLANLPCQQ